MSKDKMKEPKHSKGMEEADKASKKAKAPMKPKGKMPKMKKK